MSTSTSEAATIACEQYQALLDIAEAIVSHRDLPGLLHDLAGRMRGVVRFDYLAILLYDTRDQLLRLHVLEAPQGAPSPEVTAVRLSDDPAGWVWQEQAPLIIHEVYEEKRWPIFLELVKPFEVRSLCGLPLTSARRRLGVLIIASKQPAAYESADLGFLQQVANQVAMAVENALAFEEIEQLKEKLTREKIYLEEEIRTEHNFDEIIGDSPVLRRVLKQVETVATTDSTVLIHGETGTGKELIARAVHHLSKRQGRTFVKLNCAAIPTGLLESELFGHEKGAFTGAISQKLGRFELADGGTLFLDEIGDIPLELQPKLLRVLQEQEFERLGSTKTMRVNVRLVAATNQDLGQMVTAGRFRGDLYYRLHVFPILLPALRERREDIPLLVRHFAQRFARQMGRQIESIDADSMASLTNYGWPGNIRELQNVVERAVILSSSPHLQIALDAVRPFDEAPTAAPAANTLADAEREHILTALRASKWVIGGAKGAAARLGVKRSSLQWKMKKLGITRPD